MSFLTVEQVKAYCRNEKPTDDDEFVQAAIDAAEATLDQACQRQFTVAPASASARTYWTPTGYCLRFHDATEVTAITVGGTALSAASYILEPLNGLSWAGEARPYEQAKLLNGGTWGTDDTLTVTGKWGWAAIPARIEQAALIIAKEIIVNRDEVKLGIIGFSDVGGVTARTNPIVRETVAHYRRAEAWGIG